MKKKNLAIIAIGNELMGDDGIGPAVLHALSEHSLPEDVDLIDGGTGGFSILHIIKDYDRVLLIDSGDFGGSPGELKIFGPKEANSVKKVQRYSLHDADLMEIIRVSEKLGECPEEIHIMAVQPKKVEMGRSLSPQVEKAVPIVVEAVEKLLQQ
ncbi:MAG: hydrogenase maturation protease [Euryarchaeota archaeon]|nr:hydrogenase maturation protease [Euryarchaeota archaeon]